MGAEKTCIVVCGPTAVGKTRVAIELAKHFGTSVVSADSRQCYRELNIGVARPSADELSECKHYFIASHSIHDNITAAFFERYALDLCKELFSNNDVVIMVGGTGLYIKAFCEGLDEIPAADEEIRAQVQSGFNMGGIKWLAEELYKKDPLFYEKGEMENPRRMTRALEVVTQTGRSILSFHNVRTTARPFRIIKIGLDLPRNELYSRVDLRVDEMMQKGLLDEVRSLVPFQQLKALQTVGYSELFAHFRGEFFLTDAVELIKRNSRRYAKRQLTWFRKDEMVNWFAPDAGEILAFLKKENAGF